MRIDFAIKREIRIDAVLIGQKSCHAQLAAAAHRGQRLYFQPVLVELKRAVQLAQAVRQVLQRQRRILKINLP